MMTMRPVIGFATTLLVLGASLAQAADTTTPPPATTQTGPTGSMVCMALMSAGNKMFHSMPFPMVANRSNELALAYGQMLRDERYAAASMYAPAGTPPPELNLDCRWHATQAEAVQFKDQVIAGARGNGMTIVPTRFEPQ